MMWSLISSLREAIVLLVADVAGIFGLFNLAHFLRTGQGMPSSSLSLVWIAAMFLLTMYVCDGYRGVLREGNAKLVLRTAFAVLLAAGIVASLVYVIKPVESNALYWRGVLPVGTAMFLVWAIVWRKVAATWMQSRVRGRWLVLGYGPLASCLWHDVGGKSGLGQLCFLEEGSGDAGSRAVGMPGPEGSVSALPEFLERSWTGVILATEQAPGDAILSELMRARLRGLRIYDLTDFYERFLFKLPVLNLRDSWLILAHGFDLMHHTIQLRAKRVIDVVLSFALMLALSPVMIVTAIAIKLDSKGPVFYRQMRTGLNGVTFRLYKFRTMVENAEKFGARWTEKKDPRITRVGRFLRSTRIDELPQLWNVLLGEMSFIGPRPERPDFNDELEAAIPYYDLRHLVKPGITGWAQVLYPYGASVEDAREKLQYDLYYIKNYSVMLDLVILIRTLRVVLVGRGR
jgi:exopolysaccharide biosynthesis polyprenyl glycosylphosphotransferase